MKPAIKQHGKILTAQRLAQVERQFGIRLPAAYRAFMLENNGGSPEPNGICRKRKKTPTEVCTLFFQIDSGRDFDDWNKSFETMKDKESPVLPLRLVPIAEDPFGNLFCISVAGKDAGKIYSWDHEDSFVPTPPKRVIPDNTGLSLMADSFDDFLNQFAEVPDDIESKVESNTWESLIEAGDVQGVEAWLDKGGSLRETNGQGFVPLQLAIETDQYPIVDLFLNRGVNVEITLAVAIERNRWNLVLSVLKREKAKKLNISSGMLAETLHACNDIAVIRSMLDAGAPLHSEHFGDNPLHSVTLFNGNPQIVKLLLERGAKLEQFSANRSALANCICNGYIEAAKLLLDAGENLYTAPQKKTKTQITIENQIKDEESKPKPDRLNIKMFKQFLEHELKANAPKAPIQYFDQPERNGIPKSFKKDVIEYAAKLGQKPPA